MLGGANFWIDWRRDSGFDAGLESLQLSFLDRYSFGDLSKDLVEDLRRLLSVSERLGFSIRLGPLCAVFASASALVAGIQVH